MGWADRDDSQFACAHGVGPVGSGDKVARLLDSKSDPEIDPKADPFFEKALIPDPAGCHPNECSGAEGISVTRVGQRSDADLRQAAEEMATNRIQRVIAVRADDQDAVGATLAVPVRSERSGRGALVANVSDLRDIRLQASGDRQIVRIYDDPTPGDVSHAVIRCDETLSRSARKGLRTRIKDVFSRRVAP